MKNKKGFSLVELIVVVIIIGILVSVAIPYYNKVRERAYDKDAIASLKLIQAAQRIYRMENGKYYPTTAGTAGAGVINTNLKLFLPTANAKWTITTTTTGDPVSSFSASALRAKTDGRKWSLSDTGEEPGCTGKTADPCLP